MEVTFEVTPEKVEGAYWLKAEAPYGDGKKARFVIPIESLVPTEYDRQHCTTMLADFIESQEGDE